MELRKDQGARNLLTGGMETGLINSKLKALGRRQLGEMVWVEMSRGTVKFSGASLRRCWGEEGPWDQGRGNIHPTSISLPTLFLQAMSLCSTMPGS